MKASGATVIFWPRLSRSPAIPVKVVCGPPASGKSHYVREKAGPGDVVIDLDTILRETGGAPRGGGWGARQRALEERNRRLQSLADERRAGAAWFITTAPTGAARERWARMLRAGRAMLLLTPLEICRERILSDPERRAESGIQLAVLERWWRMYYPSRLDIIVKPILGDA